MIWRKYLQTVANNDPWEIAFRWASFAKYAVQKMDSNIIRTQDYIIAVNGLLEAIKLKDIEKIDIIAEVMAPKDDMNDESFFIDQYLYQHEPSAEISHNMAITGFLSCLAILAAWDITEYKNQMWEDNKEMSDFPEILDEIESSNYLPVFKKIILGL